MGYNVVVFDNGLEWKMDTKSKREIKKRATAILKINTMEQPEYEERFGCMVGEFVEVVNRECWSFTWGNNWFPALLFLFRHRLEGYIVFRGEDNSMFGYEVKDGIVRKIRYRLEEDSSFEIRDISNIHKRVFEKYLEMR